MDDERARYAAHLHPPGAGAGFEAHRAGGLATIRPLSVPAEAWLREHVGPEASWLGVAAVVEMRYFPALADAIIAAGFDFERDALAN